MRCDNKDDTLGRALKCAMREAVKPDDALHRKVLCSWKEERTMRRGGYKAAVAMAALLIGITVIGGGVYAAVTDSDILAWFRDRGNTISKDAEKLVESEPKTTVVDKQNELRYIHYEVDEAVCDDYTIYTRVTVTPRDKDSYLIIGDSNDLDEPASILGLEGTGEETVREYAEKAGKEIILISCSMEYLSSDWEPEDPQIGEWHEYSGNGEIYCYSRIQDAPGLDTYTEKLCVNEYRDKDGYKNAHRGTNTDEEVHSEISVITIDNKSTVRQKKEYKTVDAKLDYGITVNKISAITTELGTYVTIDYSQHGSKTALVSPGLFDEDGNEINVLGGSSGGMITHLHYGPLDMSKVFLGFHRMYNIYDKNAAMGTRVIGPYALEEVK